MKTKYEIADNIIFIDLGGEINIGKIIGIRLINNVEQYDIQYESGVLMVSLQSILGNMKDIHDIEVDGKILTDSYFSELKNKARLKLKTLNKKKEVK